MESDQTGRKVSRFLARPVVFRSRSCSDIEQICPPSSQIMQAALTGAFAANSLAISDHVAQQAERISKLHGYEPEELADEYEAFMLTTKWVINVLYNRHQAGAGLVDAVAA